MARLDDISSQLPYAAKVSLCKICGSRSTGVHYGVTACEGCKAVFKRALANPASYKCKDSGSCTIASTGWTPDLCRGCRYQKCLSMGMSLQAKRRGRVARRNMPVADIPISPSPSSSAFKAQPLPPRPVYLLLLPPAPLHYQQKPVMTSSEVTVKEDLALAQQLREDSSQKVGGVLAAAGGVEVAIPRGLCDHTDERHRITLSPNRSPSTHSTFLKALSVGLERTIKTVQSAMDSVFGQELADWNAFMQQARLNGIVPYQPQISLPRMMVVISTYLTLHVQRHCDFAYQLPGFSDLQPAEQQRLLAVKWSNSWLFVHAPYFHSDDSYILAGPDRIHYGRYWYSQIVSQSYVDSVLDFTGQLRSLRLGPLESFLLFAAQNFRPDHISDDDYSPDAETHRFLYAHYMQCFQYLLHCSRPAATVAPLLERTKVLSDRLDIFQKINDDFVRTVEANKATNNNV